IGIDVDIDLAAALAAFSQRADLHHLAVGANCDVAVGAVVRTANNFRRNKASHGAQPAHRRAGGDDWTTPIKHDPNLTLSGHDCWLVDEAEQPAALVAGLRLCSCGFCDIGNEVETQPAICAE